MVFDFAPAELLLLGAVAIVVIPPKDLPKAMRVVGHWVGKIRSVAGQFRSGFDSMVRESELAEMEKKWAEENARIMRDHPPAKAQMLPMAVSDTIEPDPLDEAAPELVEPPTIMPVPESAVYPVPVFDTAETPVAKPRTRKRSKVQVDPVEIDAAPSDPPSS